ncbi:TfuA-like protein [Luedemannella helvata]|uniref:TfuA-like core domain-containing protein n=1 Tax=Luedemannella helvata TaxID=349315 RepID=A0ABP4WVU7_9ACTN
MTDFVFVGPSLDAAIVEHLLPGAVVRPPVAHGDLLALPAVRGDRVFLIDGLFMQAAPVRHREILALLQRGVAVAGASSMGALRAAELWRFGMRGVGEIFRLYAEGVIDGDDEVAMAYAAEEGYRALSEPLVNIRIALRDAGAAGVLTPDEESALVDLARRLPFRLRGYRALRDGPGGRRFLEWLAANPRDAKAADARLLLRSAATITPPGPADDAVAHVATSFLVAWQVRSTGRQVGDIWVRDHEIITAIMLLHPEFPALHRRETLAALVGVAPTDPAVERLALAAARQRGQLDPAWAPEPGLDEDERLLRVLARGFGTVGDQTIAAHLLPQPLADEATLRVAAAFVADAELVNARLPRPDPHVPQTRRRFSDERIDATYARLWGVAVEDLEPAVWDRGLGSLEEFRVVAEQFVAGLRMFGAPSFPRTEAR